MAHSETSVVEALTNLDTLLIDTTEQMLGALSPDGRLLRANRSLVAFVGVPASQLVGTPLWSARCWGIAGIDEVRLREAVTRAAGGAQARLGSDWSDADGRCRHLALSLKPLADDAGQISLLALSAELDPPASRCLCLHRACEWRQDRLTAREQLTEIEEVLRAREQQLLHDIRIREHATARILKLSQLYAAISETNSAMLRSRSAEEVYRAVCHACVKHIGFKLAWIGVVAPDGQHIVAAEAAGPAIELLNDLTVSTRDDVPEGRRPCGTAFREQRVFMSSELRSDPDVAGVLDVLTAHGIASAIALPFQRGGKPYGTLAGYGDEKHVFDDEAVQLLEEMADNISFALDVVDRAAQQRQTQSALQRSEQRLHAAQAVCRVGDWELDRETGQMSWSQQLFELFERDPARGAPDVNEALGYYDLDSVERTRDRFWYALDSGERCALEHTLQLPSGRMSHHATHIVPVKDANGRVIKLFGTVQDVTERKVAEHDLHRKTTEIEDLYQNAPCGYHSLDGDGRITRINNTQLRWLGYTREELVGKASLIDILSPTSQAIFRQKFPWLKRVGSLRNIELELVRKNGSILPVLVSSTGIFDAAGKFVASRTVVTDNSNRKQLEFERLAHVTRLAELSRHLIEVQENERRLLASELHDRASPNLAALKITLSNLARTLPPAVLARSETLLDDADALLMDTTTGIRDICSDLRPATLDYAGLVPAVRDYAEQFGRRNGIGVELDDEGFDVQLPSNIQSPLFRIVQEALTNCAKHAAATHIRIHFSILGSAVTMTIADNGVGFDPEMPGAAGSAPGLGLLTMRERAELAGGRFAIRASRGSGTEVRVTFADLIVEDARECRASTP